MATQQSIDITKLTDIELKAIAYDLQIMITRHQQNYQAVVKELDKRFNTPTQNTGIGTESSSTSGN